MTEPNGIVEFLTARLDEDEQTAIQLGDGHRGAETWTPQKNPNGQFPYNWTVECNDGPPAVPAVYALVAAHIARHDPARVLREVAAKRRVLARHRPRDLDRSCFGCGFNNQEESMVDDIEDCPELRDLAAVYADHKDYDESWRP